MGFGSNIQETTDGRIRRIARSPEIQDAFARQIRFLRELAKALPVAVPLPEALEGDTLIYRRVPGEIVQPEWAAEHAESLAGDIAGFMTALHSVPIDGAFSWGMSAPNRTEELLSCFETVLPLLFPEDRHAARAWRDGFSGADRVSAVIHGDLWYGNLLIDPGTGRLCGVLDFDNAGVGDPAWDLAAQSHLGIEFTRLVFNAYSKRNDALWSRAKELFQLRQFEGLAWAARHGDHAEFVESLERLRAAGVLPAASRKSKSCRLRRGSLKGTR
jgi:aminoglycoside phosphotransferase (APT) family kinase protein